MTTTPAPDGANDWVLVPREPTTGMAAAFRADEGAPTFATHTTMQCADFDSRYRAMLAAAPQQAGGVDETWQHPDALPSVRLGDQGWFWVAVRRRNGRVYSFPATYLNAMPLTDENGDHEACSGNRYVHGPTDEDQGDFPATGWHSVREHGEYEGVYLPLLDDGEELVAWRAIAGYGTSAAPQRAEGGKAFDIARARTLADYVVEYARSVELQRLSSDACVALRELHAMLHAAPPSAPMGVEDKARAMFEAQADKLAVSWDRQWEPTKDFWRKRAAEALAQQPSVAPVGVDAVRKVIRAMREKAERAEAGKLVIYDPAAWADELEAALAPPPSVPEEPDVALLVSMATCLNHGFGLLDHERQQSILHDMRKLWAEVVGRGYYAPENRERYTAMLAAAPALAQQPSVAPVGVEGFAGAQCFLDWNRSQAKPPVRIGQEYAVYEAALAQQPAAVDEDDDSDEERCSFCLERGCPGNCGGDL